MAREGGEVTYATTFSGIGGWELGLNACGWELKWQCECESWCRRLLKARFDVPIYEDIRSICEQSPPPVDALIGSPPCQPFSAAGAKGGTADERHLYPSFIKLVAQIQPRWVLMEQVSAILTIDGGRAFGQYIGGLAAVGYDCIWHCIPACAVGAPHERDRLWIVAHSMPTRERRDARQDQDAGKACSTPADTNQVHGKAWLGAVQERTKPLQRFDPRERVPIWIQATNSFAGMDDGIPSAIYNDRASGLGNAVVPIIPQIIGQAINQIEGIE